MAIVAGHGLQLQVQPPKVDMDNVAGAAVPFFFVKGTTEAAKANMKFTTVKVGEWQVPVCKNKEKIDVGDQLLFYSPKEEGQQQQPTKKQKT